MRTTYTLTFKTMVTEYNQNEINNYNIFTRLKEHNVYTQKLNSLTIFSHSNVYNLPDFYKITLNISLKEIAFNKKKALTFFLALEYLTNQKCIATLSSKNVLEWKLRKGNLVGCKVSLRKNSLYDFLDNLIITLPRMEKFKGIILKENAGLKSNLLGLKLVELVLFYPIELGLGINTEVKQLDINFVFSSYNLEEQTFLLTTYKIPINNANK